VSTKSYEDQVAELERENAELDKQLADVRSARDERAELRRLQAEKAAKARELRDAPHIEAAEQELGAPGVHIYLVKSDVGTIIVKRPRRTAFTYYQEQVTRKGVPTEELNRQLIGPCLVYPDKQTFDTWVDELPFLITRTADACAFLAGIKQEDLEKK
jgi:hypothetical protein